MKPLAKIGIVVGGYVAAFAIAAAATSLYIATTSYIDRQTYSGMSAFGDSLVFLFALGAAAVPATAAALWFLRPYGRFWSVLSVAALVIAATGLLAALEYFLAQGTDPRSGAHAWSALAVLRLLVAPLFAGAFCLAAVFAPNRRARIALLLATVMDATGFACAALSLAVRAT